jgi:Cdc6-like AAA superfamily ATPase
MEVVVAPPVLDCLGDVMARVKGRLQASYTPSIVLHRETEYDEICNAVTSSLQEGVGTTVRVAGQPGQGKTLTVKHILTALLLDQEIPKFSSLFLKGSEFQGGFRSLAKDLGFVDDVKFEEQARTAVINHFCVSKCQEHGMILLIIDEIDMMPT